jgi:23S rRNA (guanosine2251-2'-O)-methyltransferase
MTEEIVAGRNAVFEALTSRRPVNKIYIKAGLQGGSLGKIIAEAQKSAVLIEYVQPEKLDRLAPGVRHQGIVALASPISFSSLEDVLKRAATRNEMPFLLLLDELQDPQNVGALIRSADAAGVHGILLPKRRSCPLNMVVAKISAGAVNYVPVVQIGNIVQMLASLKEQGFWVVGADMDGESLYFDADLDRPVVLVIGAEGKGLGRLVKENCDMLVRIPMQGGVNSLNASAAGAILMYEVVRQRMQKVAT